MVPLSHNALADAIDQANLMVAMLHEQPWNQDRRHTHLAPEMEQLDEL
jgi:hypothetical protein